MEASDSWEDGRRLSEQELMMKHFGGATRCSCSTRTMPGQLAAGGQPRAQLVGHLPRLLPEAVREVVHQRPARCQPHGPADRGGVAPGPVPALGGSASWQCGSCQAAIFYDPDNAGHPCWGCGLVPPPPAVLTVPGHTVVLADGPILTGRHLRQPRAARQVLAAAETDPRYPGAVMLRNLTDTGLDRRARGRRKEAGKPRQRLLVRPMIMELAGIRAEIRHASGGKDGFQ